MKNYVAAINEFDESNKYAELPVDQLYSYLYKGITERDAGDIKTSTSTFTKCLYLYFNILLVVSDQVSL